MKTIAFLGVGVMGEPMAAHLLDAGFKLRVWNRTRAKAAGLAARGAAVCDTPAGAVAGAETIITMVADDAAIRQVCFGGGGIVPTLSPGTIHLSMSTISAEATDEIAAAHAARGATLVAVPVFGSKESAIGKKLWAIAAGPRDAFERERDIIEAMTAGSTYLGDRPADAAAMKLIVNMLISTTAASLVQALAVGERAGLPAASVMDVVRKVFNSPLYDRYGTRLVERNRDVFFPLKLMLKDIGLVLDLGAAAGVPLPHAAGTREMIVAALGLGLADEDAAGSLARAWGLDKQ